MSQEHPIFLPLLPRSTIQTTFTYRDHVFDHVTAFYSHTMLELMPVVERITENRRQFFTADEVVLSICSLDGPLLYIMCGLLLGPLEYIQNLPLDEQKFRSQIGNVRLELSGRRNQESRFWELPYMMWESEFGIMYENDGADQ